MLESKHRRSGPTSLTTALESRFLGSPEHTGGRDSSLEPGPFSLDYLLGHCRFDLDGPASPNVPRIGSNIVSDKELPATIGAQSVKARKPGGRIGGGHRVVEVVGVVGPLIDVGRLEPPAGELVTGAQEVGGFAVELDGDILEAIDATNVAHDGTVGPPVDQEHVNIVGILFASVIPQHNIDVTYLTASGLATVAKPWERTSKPLYFIWDLQEKGRADERTRTADLISLRVIGQALQGFAGRCRTRISKWLSLPRFALCCAVLRSRWCHSGVNITLVSAQHCSPRLVLISPDRGRFDSSD